MLNGKTILITGASGHLGAFVVRQFNLAEARVLTPSRDYLDLSDIVTRSYLIRSLGHIDALIHLVGGYETKGPVANTPASLYPKMFDINFWPALNAIKGVLPGMIERQRGYIAAIAAASVRHPQMNIGAYTVSKAALAALIEAVQIENSCLCAEAFYPNSLEMDEAREAMAKSLVSNTQHYFDKFADRTGQVTPKTTVRIKGRR